MVFQYATYLDSISETSQAKKVYKRAADVHCSRKPALFLAYSAFEEKHGKLLFHLLPKEVIYNMNSEIRSFFDIVGDFYIVEDELIEQNQSRDMHVFRRLGFGG